MSDLIRREDAIKALYKYIFVSKDIIEREINAIPSADLHSEFSEWARHWFKDSADRPQGEWVKHDDERDYCSRCKHIFKTRTITQQDKWALYIDDLGYNYCPNCGADMKGADDD